MRKLVVGILIGLLVVSRASAQEIMKYPTSPESQNYTYVVKEDGTARAWLRADSVVVPLSGGEYQLTLPDNYKGEVLGWYRENGCPEYVNYICTWRGGNSWKEAKVKVENGELNLTIPERKIAKQDETTPVTIGISFATEDITTKRWWGREVGVATAKPKQFVAYLSVGVYMPDGVYVRDTQQGPAGWGQAMSEMMGASGMRADNTNFAKMAAPTMLDMAGGGQINRSWNNLMPGEDYGFKFMSSTSTWKLYAKELGWGAIWASAIAAVIALLLRMLIPKKSLGWYLGLVGLLIVLFILIGGLWVGYRFIFSYGPSGGSYPMPLLRTIEKSDVGGVVDPGLAPESISE
ncbi:MAG: hypothetical protein V1487_02785 [bacterium]